MCIFAESVQRVSNTQIIVASTTDGRQFTAYSNNVVSVARGNAMVLPVPAGKVDFVNLEYAADLMKECERLFPDQNRTRGAMSFSFGGGFGSKGVLPTEKVGGYTCSVVPTLADFGRIDQRVFVLPKNTEALLKENYPEGFSFIVCQFDKEVKGHPIAYIHSLHTNGNLFIPTFHGHDGGQSGVRVHKDGFTVVHADGWSQPFNRDSDTFVYAGGSPGWDENDARRRGNNNNNNFQPPDTNWGSGAGWASSKQSNQNDVVHQGITCDICKKLPLTGTRYKCMHCPDFDACKGCRHKHDANHVFAELKFEADTTKLWSNAPILLEPVYNNVRQKRTTEEYDHTIYILNGMCRESSETYTEQTPVFVDRQGRSLVASLAGLGVMVDLFIAQKLTIKGHFANRDYSASVCMRK